MADKTNVRALSSRNNLRNIPHMLRNLANEIESGNTPTPDTMLLIAIRADDEPPDLYVFGEDGKRLRDIGALQFVATNMQAVELEPIAGGG